MSAIFDFSSLVTVILLFICTCAYLRGYRQTIFDSNEGGRHEGVRGLCWKAARIGERLSPYVGAFCVAMAIQTLFLK
ncbi:unnamed protein product [Phaeothamnion confervicola]